MPAQYRTFVNEKSTVLFKGRCLVRILMTNPVKFCMCLSAELCRVPPEGLNNMSRSLYPVDVAVTRLFRVFE